MSGPELERFFPLAYAHWYAACLYLEAGHSPKDILRRLDIDARNWTLCNDRYAKLHFVDVEWAANALEREGVASAETNLALYERLMSGSGIDLSVAQPFSLRARLELVRRIVQAAPRLGPFADMPGEAHYLCERVFPTVRYLRNGPLVMVGGRPLWDRKGEPLAGIDALTFRQLGKRWFRDDHRVYGQGETPTRYFWFVVRGADPETFVVLNERYAVDKAAGYYITNRRLPTHEPGTFEIVSYYYGHGQKPGVHREESHYAKDSRKVYAYGSQVEGAHAPSFHAIGDEGTYFADQHRVYWQKLPLIGADRDTFTCASEAGQYRAYDKNQPYWRGMAESVTEAFEHWRDYFEARSELTDTWWHRELARRETAADQRTGELLTPLGGPFFSDGIRVLVEGKKGERISLDHIDHASFKHLTGIFGADTHGLRYAIPGWASASAAPVSGADPGSFQALRDGWYRDDRQAYFVDMESPVSTLVVVKADMASFQVLGGAYARDAKGLIVEGVRKRGIANAGSVVALGHLFARMGNTILYRGKPVARPGSIDLETARSVHSQILLDAQGHMLLGSRYRKPIHGLDVTSFRFINRRFARDHQRVYAYNWDSVLVCEAADPASLVAVGTDAARDRMAYWHFSARGELQSLPDAATRHD